MCPILHASHPIYQSLSAHVFLYLPTVYENRYIYLQIHQNRMSTLFVYIYLPHFLPFLMLCMHGHDYPAMEKNLHIEQTFHPNDDALSKMFPHTLGVEQTFHP